MTLGLSDVKALFTKLVYDLFALNTNAPGKTVGKEDKFRKWPVDSWGDYEVPLPVVDGLFKMAMNTAQFDDLLEVQEYLDHLRINEFAEEPMPVEAVEFTWEDKFRYTCWVRCYIADFVPANIRQGTRWFVYETRRWYSERDDSATTPSVPVFVNMGAMEQSCQMSHNFQNMLARRNWLKNVKPGDMIHWVDPKDEKSGEYVVVHIGTVGDQVIDDHTYLVVSPDGANDEEAFTIFGHELNPVRPDPNPKE